MDRIKEQYSDKKEREYVSQDQPGDLEQLLPEWIAHLPEWIAHLKDYFERKPPRGYSSSG